MIGQDDGFEHEPMVVPKPPERPKTNFFTAYRAGLPTWWWIAIGSALAAVFGMGVWGGLQGSRDSENASKYRKKMRDRWRV